MRVSSRVVAVALGLISFLPAAHPAVEPPQGSGGVKPFAALKLSLWDQDNLVAYAPWGKEMKDAYSLAIDRYEAKVRDPMGAGKRQIPVTYYQTYGVTREPDPRDRGVTRYTFDFGIRDHEKRLTVVVLSSEVAGAPALEPAAEVHLNRVVDTPVGVCMGGAYHHAMAQFEKEYPDPNGGGPRQFPTTYYQFYGAYRDSDPWVDGAPVRYDFVFGLDEQHQKRVTVRSRKFLPGDHGGSTACVVQSVSPTQDVESPVQR
jgi:hypothetical protein